MLPTNQELLKIKIRIHYKTSASQKILAQSHPCSHFLYKHIQKRHESSWEQERKNQKQDRWDYFHLMPMLPLLGTNHHLWLLHMAKDFIWIEEIGKRMNEFEIGYMIKPSLHIIKSFKSLVEKCMITTFVELTQPFIKTTLEKKG